LVFLETASWPADGVSVAVDVAGRGGAMDDPVERLKDGFHKFKTEVYE
jgi:hypothetical protein